MEAGGRGKVVLWKMWCGSFSFFEGKLGRDGMMFFFFQFFFLFGCSLGIEDWEVFEMFGGGWWS